MYLAKMALGIEIVAEVIGNVAETIERAALAVQVANLPRQLQTLFQITARFAKMSLIAKGRPQAMQPAPFTKGILQAAADVEAAIIGVDRLAIFAHAHGDRPLQAEGVGAYLLRLDVQQGSTPCQFFHLLQN